MSGNDSVFKIATANTLSKVHVCQKIMSNNRMNKSLYFIPVHPTIHNHVPHVQPILPRGDHANLRFSVYRLEGILVLKRTAVVVQPTFFYHVAIQNAKGFLKKRTLESRNVRI